MRGKMLSALAYPIVLTLVAIAVVAALMIAVVPQVVEQFDDVGQQLPLLTRIVIAHQRASSPVLVGAAARLGVGSALLGWRAAAGAERSASPSIGCCCDCRCSAGCIRDLHAARMARTLSTMIESRLPLIEGLRLTAGTIHNRALRAATDGDGRARSAAAAACRARMARAGVFPPLLVYLAASGESAGQLDVMLARAADYLEREFDNFTATALSMLEPAIIVVMGAIVATDRPRHPAAHPPAPDPDRRLVPMLRLLPHRFTDTRPPGAHGGAARTASPWSN